ncbi:MAG: hypothetical protein H7A37_09465 [Chlamydiales bacterium]|nr:hypothetical protein [Chlamydiia bacterium]MCP5508505.1 hypothetical protein [Chlamydiales bacterium]
MSNIVNFEYRSPEKDYPLVETSEQCLKFLVTPSAKKTGEQVYRIKAGERRYIGATSRSLFARGNEHARNKIKQLVEKENLSPSAVKIGRVAFVPEGEKIENLEQWLILQTKSHLNGLNGNSGKGGGLTKASYMKRKLNAENEPLPIRTKPSPVSADLREPIRWYPLDTEGVLSLPAKVAEYSGEAIYVFEADGKRLYGYTGQNMLQERLKGYFNENSHPELLKIVRERPESVKFSLVEAVASDQDLGDRERAYILAYKTHEIGFNRTRGGNGCRPYYTNKRRRLAPSAEPFVSIKIS